MNQSETSVDRSPCNTIKKWSEKRGEVLLHMHSKNKTKQNKQTNKQTNKQKEKKQKKTKSF